MKTPFWFASLQLLELPQWAALGVSLGEGCVSQGKGPRKTFLCPPRGHFHCRYAGHLGSYDSDLLRQTRDRGSKARSMVPVLDSTIEEKQLLRLTIAEHSKKCKQ